MKSAKLANSYRIDDGKHFRLDRETVSGQLRLFS